MEGKAKEEEWLSQFKVCPDENTIRKFCVSWESKLGRDEIVCLFTIVQLFRGLEFYIKQVDWMTRSDEGTSEKWLGVIKINQEQVAKYYKMIKNYKPSQKEIEILSVAYDEFKCHKKELRKYDKWPWRIIAKNGNLVSRIHKLRNEAKKFQNSKMLWNLLLDIGLSNECLYVKGNRLSGAGFSKQ